MSETPIVFICFNRYETTIKTFEKIRFYKPKKLYLIIDYPRKNNKKDEENNNQIKIFFEKKIDWSCEVIRDYSKVNLGLKKRIITGLNKVFEIEKKAIILEDDCYPHNDFFYFCDLMLERYFENKKIMFITGNNFQDKNEVYKSDYYFSKYTHIWGWATWRDTWKKIIFDDSYWKSKFENNIKFDNFVHHDEEYEYWKKFYYLVTQDKLQSWSLYLLFSIWENNGLTVTPNQNLIKNLGLNEGTNMKNFINITKFEKNPLKKPLNNNTVFEQNVDKDLNVFRKIYKPSLLSKIFNYIKSFI
jgi:hypothetical protein|tara:strand:- start:21193 stop:22095 length:903 start_codon:yes stop_codon:yes gene_type:complete